MIKVVKLNSLFWDNGTWEKPSSIPDVSRFTTLDNVVVDWEDHKITGTVILQGDWNYAYIEEQFYFLRRDNVADRNNNTWEYIVIKDFWINWLKNKVSIRGYCTKTTNKGILLNNIHYVKPLIYNPVKQLKLNLKERDIDFVNFRFFDVDAVYHTQKRVSEKDWQNFVLQIIKSIADSKTPTFNGKAIIATLEATEQDDEDIHEQIELFRLISDSSLSNILPHRVSVTRLTDSKWDNTILKGLYAISPVNLALSDTLERIRIKNFWLDNVASIHEFSPIKNNIGSDVDSDFGTYSSDDTFHIEWNKSKINELLRRLKGLGDLTNWWKSISPEKTNNNIYIFKSKETYLYNELQNWVTDDDYLYTGVIPENIKVSASGKVPYYGEKPLQFISKTYPTKKFYLPTGESVKLNYKDGEVKVEKLEDGDFGISLGTKFISQDDSRQLIVTGLKKGWYEALNTVKNKARFIQVLPWIERVNKKWNNFTSIVDEHSLISYILFQDDKLYITKDKWDEWASNAPWYGITPKKDGNVSSESVISIWKNLDRLTVNTHYLTEPVTTTALFTVYSSIFNSLVDDIYIADTVTQELPSVFSPEYKARKVIDWENFFRELKKFKIVAYLQNDRLHISKIDLTKQNINFAEDSNNDIQAIVQGEEELTNLEIQNVTFSTTPLYQYIQKQDSITWNKRNVVAFLKTSDGKEALDQLAQGIREGRGWWQFLGTGTFTWGDPLSERWKNKVAIKGEPLKDLWKLKDGTYDYDKIWILLNKGKDILKETLIWDSDNPYGGTYTEKTGYWASQYQYKNGRRVDAYTMSLIKWSENEWIIGHVVGRGYYHIEKIKDALNKIFRQYNNRSELGNKLELPSNTDTDKLINILYDEKLIKDVLRHGQYLNERYSYTRIPKILRNKYFDLVGSHFYLYIDNDLHCHYIVKKNAEREVFNFNEYKTYKLEPTEFPSQDIYDIINQQLAIQVYNTTYPIQDKLISFKSSPNIRSVDDFSIQINKAITQNVSASDYIFVRYEGEQQLIDSKQAVPKQQTQTTAVTDILASERLTFEREKWREQFNIQQNIININQKRTLEQLEIEDSIHNLNQAKSLFGAITGIAKGAISGGLANIGLSGVTSVGNLVFNSTQVALDRQETESKRKNAIAIHVEKSARLRTKHKFEEQKFAMMIRNIGNNYELGEITEMDIMTEYFKKNNVEDIHLIYKVPSEIQKEAIKRSYSLYGVDCQIPNVVLELSELKEGDIWCFAYIDKFVNVTHFEEKEALRNLLQNGIKIISFDEVIENQELLPKISKSWWEKMRELLAESDGLQRDRMFDTLTQNMNAWEIVSRLIELVKDNPQLIEKVAPLINEKQLLREVLAEKSEDEVTDIVIGILDKLNENKLFNRLLLNQDKKALVMKWLKGDVDLLDVIWHAYSDTIVNKEDHDNIVNEHKTSIKLYEDEVKTLTGDLTRINKDLGEALEEIENQKKELNTTKINLSKSIKQRNVLLSEITSLKADKDENKREIDNLKKILKDVNQKIKDLQDKIGIKEGSIIAKDKEILDKKKEIADIQHKLNDITHQLDDIKSKKEHVEKENVTLNEELENANRYIGTLAQAYDTKEKELEGVLKELKQVEEKWSGNDWEVEVDGERYGKDTIRELGQKKNDLERELRDIESWIADKGGKDKLEQSINIDKWVTEQGGKESLENTKKEKDTLTLQFDAKVKELEECQQRPAGLIDAHKNIDYLITERDGKVVIAEWNKEKSIWQENADLTVKRRDETKLLRIANKKEKYETDQYPLWSYYRQEHGSKFTINVSTFSILDNYINTTNIKQAHSWVGRYSVEIDKNMPFIDKDGNWVKPYWYHPTKGWFDYDIGEGAEKIDSYERYLEISKNLVNDLQKKLEEQEKSLSAVREIEDAKNKEIEKLKISQNIKWVTRMYNRFTVWQTANDTGGGRVYVQGTWAGERQLHEQPAVVMKDGVYFKILIPVFFGIRTQAGSDSKDVYWIPFFFNVEGSDKIMFGNYGQGNMLKYSDDTRKKGYVPDYYASYINKEIHTWTDVRKHILDVGGNTFENAKKNPVNFDAKFEFRFTNQYLPFVGYTAGITISGVTFSHGDMSWNKPLYSGDVVFDVNNMKFIQQSTNIYITPDEGNSLKRVKDMQDYVVCMLGYDIWENRTLSKYFYEKYKGS